jgi:hypothetical protein
VEAFLSGDHRPSYKEYVLPLKLWEVCPARLAVAVSNRKIFKRLEENPRHFITWGISMLTVVVI